MAKDVKPKAREVPEVENIRPGTTLHLGDGRKLAFGERAEVTQEIADIINGKK